MRALALHVIALAMFIGTNLAGHVRADEFKVFDGGSSTNSFEIVDGPTASGDPGTNTPPMDALQQPLDSYLDPVVDQPQTTAELELEPKSDKTEPESYRQPESVTDADSQPIWDTQESLGDIGYQYDDAAYGSCNDGDCGGACGGSSRSCGGSACRGSCGGNRAGAFIDLWVAGGFTYNDADPAGGFNTPLTFNDFANEGQFNQAYLTFGRAVNKCGGCWDLGGRVDLLYGTDYFFTTADGLETRGNGAPHWNSSDGDRRRLGFTFADYGLAMPQLYGEIFAPIGTGLGIKFGHFYTPLGYESVRAPENFFYSHSYTFQYGKPITHTGVMTDWALGSNFNVQTGYTRGWNNWEDANGKPNYLFGFTWCPSKIAALAFSVTTGDEDPAGQNNRTVYTLVYTRRVGVMTYVLEHTFGTEENAEFNNQFQSETGKWYGLNQYFFMDVSPTLTTGMRIEWFRDQDNTRVLQIPFESSVSGGNYVGLTMGMNWRPSCNLIIRPEVRYDYSDVEAFGFGNDGVYDDFTERDQLTLAVDAIFRF